MIVGYGLKAPSDRRVRLVLAWFVTTVLFLAAHLAVQLAARAGIALPPVVPGFHFLFYLTALVSLAIGVGLRDLCVAGLARLGSGGAERLDVQLPRRAGLVVCLATCLLVAAYSQPYLDRDDFTELRSTAVSMNAEMPADAYAWIRDSHHTSRRVSLHRRSEPVRCVAGGTQGGGDEPVFLESVRRLGIKGPGPRGDVRAVWGGVTSKGSGSLPERYDVGYIVLPERAPSDFWLKVSGLYRRDIPAVHADDLTALPGFRLVFRGPAVAIVAVDSRRS